MKFVFIRHGEATHNVAFRETKDEKVFTDEKHKDAPLTEAGIQQAQELALKLAEMYPEPVAIWSSPLTRAVQTAEELFEELNTSGQIILHDGLLEFQDAYHKCNTRLPRHDLEKKFSAWNLDLLPELPPFWLESEPAVYLKNRMKMVLTTIKELEKYVNTVIIVSHKNAIYRLTGVDLENCGYVEKTYEELMAN